MRVWAARRPTLLVLALGTTLAGVFTLTGCGSILGYGDEYVTAAPDDGAAGAAGAGEGGASASGAAAGTSAGASAGASAGGADGGAAGDGQAGVAGVAGAAGQSGGAGGGGQAGASGQAGQGGASGQAGDGGQAGEAGASGQAGAEAGGNAGQAGDGGAAGQAGQAGQSGAGGAAGEAGQSGAGGAAGQAGASGQGGQAGACALPTAPTTTCGDTTTAAGNCGACGLSCSSAGSCALGMCAVDPPETAPYRLQRSYFVQGLAYSSLADRLLFREETSLWEAGLSGDPLSPKKLAGGTVDINGTFGTETRSVYHWKSARYASEDSIVVAIAGVAQEPEAYPPDRVLATFNRSSGAFLGARLLPSNHDHWAVQRRMAGGLTGAVETHDAPVVFKSGDRSVAAVWEFSEGAKGVFLRGYSLPIDLGEDGVELMPPRYNISRVVTDGDNLFYASKAAESAPWRMRSVTLLGGDPIETEISSTNLSNPTDLAVVGDRLFVLDAGADPAAGAGSLWLFDLRDGCTAVAPILIATGLVYPSALAVDDTRVYIQEVRPGQSGGKQNVVTRRFQDGTGAHTIVTEARGPFYSDGDDENVERLQKGLIPITAYGQAYLLFSLGSDPGDYRGPLDYLLGVPR